MTKDELREACIVQEINHNPELEQKALLIVIANILIQQGFVTTEELRELKTEYLTKLAADSVDGLLQDIPDGEVSMKDILKNI